MLLDVVACCCSKFETGQTFQPTTPNISFVPWTPKRSATMMDPFGQLFQHCWGHARSFRVVYKDLWLYPSHDALQVPTLLGVVASVCTTLSTRMQQLQTLLAQQCWELLRPFARSLRIDLFFTFYHSVFFMIIANITILIFFFMIKNIGTVIIIQLTKASMFLTITDVFSIAHLKVFQTPWFNDNVSILLLWMSIPFIGHCLDNE